MINHRTTKPKNKAEYNIETGQYQKVQENILRYLNSQGRVCGKNKLLPCSLYRKEKLSTAVKELLNKNAIRKIKTEGNHVYELSDKPLQVAES